MALASVTSHPQLAGSDAAVSVPVSVSVSAADVPGTSASPSSSSIQPPTFRPYSPSGGLPSLRSPSSSNNTPSNALGPPPRNPTMSQSQPSSQQSLAMSQPQSQPQYRHQLPEHGRKMSYTQDPPQIYSAVYSGVDVYEMEVNGIAVMRRRNDSWLNATQILKVARIDKGKRTKILEKEIQTGEHEKVQGGYGKYQGTWIRFERGVEVCQHYGVEEVLRPLLTYDMGQDGGVAGRGDLHTPTKEQAMAAQRKRMYSSSQEHRVNGSLSGTFFRNISNSASNAVAAISKARFDSPGPRGRNGPTRPPSFSRQSSMQNVDEFPGNSQQSLASDYGQGAENTYSSQPTQHLNGAYSPRKRQRVITPAESLGYTSQSMEMYANNYPGSPTEPNDSFVYSQAGINVHDTDVMPQPPLPYDVSPEAEEKRNLLMQLFLDGKHADDPSSSKAFKTLDATDLDAPIDASSHTALHWAATLARIPLLRTLIAAGANPCRVNASGETALMRASAVTNNSDQISFPELLDVLGDTIEIRDSRGRTVLHHIALTSAVKGRSHSSRYYLESLLEWVVRQGSAPSSQNAAINGATTAPKMGIGRFMSEIVNAQDRSGDTALSIASRVGNRSIISQLLEVGADPNIANAAGLRPADFGVGVDTGEDGVNGDAAGADKMGVIGNNHISRESSDDIISSITHLLTETSTSFQSELRKKQADLDSLHANLRSTSTQLGDARRTLDSLQAAAHSQSLTRQKIHNLSRGRDEEQKRLARLEQSHGPLDENDAWEVQIATMPEDATDERVPSATVLRARIQALRNRTDLTRAGVASLKGRSKEVEVKYRRVVALCTNSQVAEVDSHIDNLLRAVESEKHELDMGRVRRFLGGVDSIA
ncbi:start control protein cdc10 [Xylariomycetidae sp. FL0641]|nr:start control protein cdc10 [Xylariomycetidae sp. FL0641]